ncbi:TPA: heparinase, partial [Candidatus Poribacteria bacterium]|nr:heparinase [Candidatus Poribacteria bacterium]
MLSKIYPEETLRTVLLPRGVWHPYPTVEEREHWEFLPQSIRQTHITRGKEALNYEWPTILAVRFLDFIRDGNRDRYQSVSFERRRILVNLVIAECMEGKG